MPRREADDPSDFLQNGAGPWSTGNAGPCGTVQGQTELSPAGMVCRVPCLGYLSLRRPVLVSHHLTL